MLTPEGWLAKESAKRAALAMALGALDRIPKDRIVESEEEAGTLAWSLVQRP